MGNSNIVKACNVIVQGRRSSGCEWERI